MALIPKNWTQFQHYKDRKPPWIKLHGEILDDYDYFRLPVASKALAPLLWLLAREYKDGEIDAPLEEIAFRMRMSVSELIDGLRPLIDAKFFSFNSDVTECFHVASVALAARTQVALPETERETQEQVDGGGGGAPDPAPPKPSVEASPKVAAAENLVVAGKLFEDFWRDWKGGGQKEATKRAFFAAIRDGVHPDAIIFGSRRQASGEGVASAEDWIVGRKFEGRRLISDEAQTLADEISGIAGHDPKNATPTWMGAAMRVQEWLNQGWQRDVILLAVRKIMAGKKDGPPHSIKFFETGIAREIAQMAAPLPEVVNIPATQVEAGREATQHHTASDYRTAKDAGRAAHAKLRDHIATAERALAGGSEGGGQAVELLPPA